jgi:hypothetical protein
VSVQQGRREREKRGRREREKERERREKSERGRAVNEGMPVERVMT